MTIYNTTDTDSSDIKLFVCYHIEYCGNKFPPNYIGSTSLEKINDGYMGSVCSKEYAKSWKDEIKNNKHLFKLTIISYHTTRTEAYDKELKLQKIFNVIENDLFVNRSFACSSFSGNSPKSEDHKQKIGIANSGKKRSQEQKNRIKECNKNKIVVVDINGNILQINKEIYHNQPLENKQYVTINSYEGMRRRNLSEDEIEAFRKNSSEKQTGKTLSQETRLKISNKQTGKVMPDETRRNLRKPKSKEHRIKLSNVVTVVDKDKNTSSIPITEYNKIKNLPNEEKPFFTISSKIGMEILGIERKSHLSRRPDGTSLSSDLTKEGRNVFLKNKGTVACYDKNVNYVRIPMDVYRNQKGIKSEWEWVSIVSKEGHLRKLSK